MDAGSNSSDGSSARNASTSVRNASRSSLNSGGALKSKLGRWNSNSKQGVRHADCGEGGYVGERGGKVEVKPLTSLRRDSSFSLK
jgi:hypothetical protein